jgi:predicted membrane protein
MWLTLGAMLLAAALALWLLIRPELISGLPMPLRLPAIALGVWALGAAFMQPLGLEFRRHWLRRATSPPLSLAALGAFILVVIVRALWLA